jgi:hypothetical protein
MRLAGLSVGSRHSAVKPQVFLAVFRSGNQGKYAALSRFSKIPPTRLDSRGTRGAGIALCQMASAAEKRACE